MLVATDGVEAASGRVLELVEEVVVHVMRALGIEQRGMDVDPDRGVLVLEVVGQLLVGHQVEPQEFHGSLSCPRRGGSWPTPLILPTTRPARALRLSMTHAQRGS